MSRKRIYSNINFEPDNNQERGDLCYGSAGVHFLCIALRYNNPEMSKNHKSIPFINFLK